MGHRKSLFMAIVYSPQLPIPQPSLLGCQSGDVPASGAVEETATEDITTQPGSTCAEVRPEWPSQFTLCVLRLRGQGAVLFDLPTMAFDCRVAVMQQLAREEWCRRRMPSRFIAQFFMHKCPFPVILISVIEAMDTVGIPRSVPYPMATVLGYSAQLITISPIEPVSLFRQDGSPKPVIWHFVSINGQNPVGFCLCCCPVSCWAIAQPRSLDYPCASL